MGNPLGKCQFFDFWNSCFYSEEKRFFVLEYRKRHFPGLYCLKKKFEKMAFFGPKLWNDPFTKNVNFSTIWTSCFYTLERRFFLLEYRKRHFFGLYCLKKKSLKNGHFWTKTMGYPLWKYFNFSTFWTSCFNRLERCVFDLEYR